MTGLNIHTIRLGIAYLLVLITSIAFPLTTALAVTIPTFPTCSNPQGELIVRYNSGVHGIVGSTKTYTGADEVYRLTNITSVQCFCDEAGNGIQTNWWKTSSLTSAEQKTLTRQGWTYVPDGSAWGLSSGSYYAKNDPYLCKGGLGGGQVLGLASTGSIQIILILLVAGSTTVATGVYLRLKTSL